MSALPDPIQRPLLSVDEVLGVLPLRRTALYEAINRGELPTLRYGRRVFVVNARLQEQLGLRTPPNVSEAGPASPATATDNEVCGGPRHDQHPTIRAV